MPKPSGNTYTRWGSNTAGLTHMPAHVSTATWDSQVRALQSTTSSNGSTSAEMTVKQTSIMASRGSALRMTCKGQRSLDVWEWLRGHHIYRRLRRQTASSIYFRAQGMCMRHPHGSNVNHMHNVKWPPSRAQPLQLLAFEVPPGKC